MTFSIHPILFTCSQETSYSSPMEATYRVFMWIQSVIFFYYCYRIPLCDASYILSCGDEAGFYNGIYVCEHFTVFTSGRSIDINPHYHIIASYRTIWYVFMGTIVPGKSTKSGLHNGKLKRLGAFQTPPTSKQPPPPPPPPPPPNPSPQATPHHRHHDTH